MRSVFPDLTQTKTALAPKEQPRLKKFRPGPDTGGALLVGEAKDDDDRCQAEPNCCSEINGLTLR
jgi:hypothetical protein